MIPPPTGVLLVPYSTSLSLVQTLLMLFSKFAYLCTILRSLTLLLSSTSCIMSRVHCLLVFTLALVPWILSLRILMQTGMAVMIHDVLLLDIATPGGY